MAAEEARAVLFILKCVDALVHVHVCDLSSAQTAKLLWEFSCSVL